MATVGKDGKEGSESGKEGKDGSDTGKEGKDGKEGSDTGKEASDPFTVDTGDRAVYEQGLLQGVPIVPRVLMRVEVEPSPRGREVMASDPLPTEQDQSREYWSLVEGFGILAGYTKHDDLRSSLTLSVTGSEEARAIAENDPLVTSGLMEVSTVRPFE